MPNAGRCELDAVARWVSDVDGTAAVRPLEVRLDVDPGCAEPMRPRVEVIDRERDVTCSGCPVRRDGPGAPSGRFRIEDEHHASATAEKEMSPRHLRLDLEAERARVEVLRRVQVAGVERRLEDADDRH